MTQIDKEYYTNRKKALVRSTRHPQTQEERTQLIKEIGEERKLFRKLALSRRDANLLTQEEEQQLKSEVEKALEEILKDLSKSL